MNYRRVADDLDVSNVGSEKEIDFYLQAFLALSPTPSLMRVTSLPKLR